MEATTLTPTLELLTPGDPGYDEARVLHNGMYDNRPALIALCAGPPDVAAALRHARDTGLRVSVRGGAHHVTGQAVVEGGLVIDTSPMRRVDVDPAARVARVEGAVRWGELDAAAQAYGLAVTGGRDSTTGVIGLTLGSGSGWLERRLGRTGDNLLAAELVTAGGREVRVTAESDPELFWGLRGAGANFGVVTALELRLHPVGPVVYGGMLLFADADRAAVLRRWRDAPRPETLGDAVALITAPPEPFVPEALHGRPATGVFVCFSGDPADGAEACAPLREIGDLAVEMLGPMPYTEAQKLIEPTAPWGLRAYWKAEAVRSLGDDALAALVAGHDRCPSPQTIVVVEPKGGAIARVPEDATALGGRSSSHEWFSFSAWEDADDDDANIAWTRELAASMKPFSADGIGLNFVAEHDRARLASTFGEAKLARLRALKRAWDPENVFRSCANVAP